MGMARLAAGFAKEHRRNKMGVVLVLGEGLIEQGTVNVGPLKGPDLRRSLHRKAGNLLSDGIKETVFAAVPMMSNEAAGEWLLFAMLRRDGKAIRQEFRRQGVNVTRVASSRMAQVAAAAGHAEEDETVVCVGVGQTGVTISLVSEGQLAQITRLQGNYSESPSMATSLLQELRGLDAFWRKRSRGGKLSRVVLVGLDTESAEQIAPAIHASLPGTQVERFASPNEEQIAPEDLGRASALSAALASGELQVDFSIPLPPRVPVLAATALVVAVSTAGVANRVKDELIEERSDYLAEVEQLKERTAPVASLDAQFAEIESTLARLEAEQARQAALAAEGIDLKAVLPGTMNAFRGLAAPIAVTMEARKGEEVVFSGIASSDPNQSLQALQRLVVLLEATPWCEKVALRPPTGVPESQEGQEDLLEFSIQAEWALGEVSE